jgi:hypothetical protein
MNSPQRRAAHNDSPDAHARSDRWAAQSENRCWASGRCCIKLTDRISDFRAGPAGETELVGSEIGESQRWRATTGAC